VNDDPQKLRAYLDRIEDQFRTETDREAVRILAKRLVNMVDGDGHFKLMVWVQAIPVDIYANTRNPMGVEATRSVTNDRLHFAQPLPRRRRDVKREDAQPLADNHAHR
jgi:hypothetical protein